MMARGATVEIGAGAATAYRGMAYNGAGAVGGYTTVSSISSSH